MKPFDWSYTTDYKGTTADDIKALSTSSKPIPMELLKLPDPIKFFEEVMLYEDELADNGIAMLSCKVRIMPDRLLLLCRYFMRLDNVVVRVRDTRVYVEFPTGEFIREYTAREEQYAVIKQKLAANREDGPASMRDPTKLSGLMPIVGHSLETIQFG